MDMTEKLYDVNAYLTEFDAAVVSCQVLKEGTERDVNGQLEVAKQRDRMRHSGRLLWIEQPFIRRAAVSPAISVYSAAPG